MSEVKHITNRSLKKLPRELVEEYQLYINGFIAHKGYAASSTRAFLKHYVCFLSYVRDKDLPYDVQTFLLRHTSKPAIELPSESTGIRFFSAIETFFDYVIKVSSQDAGSSFFDLRHNPFQVGFNDGDPRGGGVPGSSDFKLIKNWRLEKLPQDLIEEYQPYANGFVARCEFSDKKAKIFLRELIRFLAYIKKRSLPFDVQAFILRETHKPAIKVSPSHKNAYRFFNLLEDFFDYIICELNKNGDHSFFELRCNPFRFPSIEGDPRKFRITTLEQVTSVKLQELPSALVAEYQPFINGYITNQQYSSHTTNAFLTHLVRFLRYVRDEGLPFDIKTFILRRVSKPPMVRPASEKLPNRYISTLDLFFAYVISVINKGGDVSFFELRHNPFGFFCLEDDTRHLRVADKQGEADHFKYLTNYDYDMREWAEFANRYVRHISKPFSYMKMVSMINSFFRGLIQSNRGKNLSLDNVLSSDSDVIIQPHSKKITYGWTRFLGHVIAWNYEKDPTRFLVDRGRGSRLKTGEYLDISVSGAVNFLWVRNFTKDLEKLRLLAVEYVAISEAAGIQKKYVLQTLLKAFILNKELPREPIEIFNPKYRKFINVDSLFPDNASSKVTSWNQIVKFFEWVRVNHLSKLDDEGNLTSIVENPYKVLVSGKSSPERESVYPCLPYLYIKEIKVKIVQGPNFKDWEYIRSLGSWHDWIVIDESLLDKDDPDCIYRERKVIDKTYYEIWSPVRAVAILTKLILPLRTFQVRHLDSGEADHMRFIDNKWGVNSSRLNGGNKNWQQGVFRKSDDGLNLYINTNKTADNYKSKFDLGYVMPWLTDVALDGDIVHWFQKLARWQETYFPMVKKTSWRAYAKQVTKDKMELEAAKYPDACFLFRTPSPKGQFYPITNGAVDGIWFKLLRDYEDVLRSRSKSEGDYIKLINVEGKRTHFPLHSLRVSIITALFTDGEMSSELLMKVVGHCRLIMTLHYVKPVGEFLKKKLREADEKVQNGMDADLQSRLMDYEIDQLKETVVLDDSGLSQIDVNPNARNPIGWLHMSYGMCLAGGNTHGAIDQPGCHNGGKKTSRSNYSSVPGGSINCIRCRWFVTDPSYLNNLIAHFNNISFRLHDLKERMFALEEVVSGLKKERYTVELEGNVYEQNGLLAAKESLLEEHTAKLVNASNDLAACWKIIQKCKERLGDESLALIGDRESFDLVIEETDSELLQLMGVCEDLEMVPNLNAADAIFRRSQILDSALVASGQGIMFASLSKEEQLLVGNKFVRKLAHQLDAENAYNGRKKLVRIIEGGDFGKKLGSVEQLLLF